MKMLSVNRRFVLAFVLAFVSGFGYSAMAQRPIVISQAVLDSIANPPMDEDAALEFDFEEAEIFIMDTDVPRLIVFPFTNVGDRELHITKTSATCGCATVRFTSDAVSPGQTGEIAVSYNPHNQVGPIDRYVYVYTDASELHPVARLALKGEVVPADRYYRYPVKLGSLRAKRSVVDFGQMSRGEIAVERILVCNSSQDVMSPSALPGLLPESLESGCASGILSGLMEPGGGPEVLPAWLGFRCEPETLLPDGEGELFVSVDTGKIPSGCTGRIEYPLVITGPDCPPSRRTLTVIIYLID